MNRPFRPNGDGWRRWHRVLGITSAVFVLLLAVTGIALNHTEALRLDERHAAPDWLLSLYGIEPAGEPVSYRAGDEWITWLDGRLFFGAKVVAREVPRVLGVAGVPPVRVVATQDSVWLYTADGRLVERMTAAAGVPEGIDRIGVNGDGRVVLAAAAGPFTADRDLTGFEPGAAGEVNWSAPAEPPEALARDLRETWRGRGLPLERVLLDLHSGRILGTPGVWLMDAMALIFLTLSVSGLWIWWRRRRQVRPGRGDRFN